MLQAEARALRLSNIEGQVGGVRFEGPEADGWRAVLHLRTAVRVYRHLARFEAATAKELYQGAQLVDWKRIFGLDQTFAVDAKVGASDQRHSGFVTLKIKDALADWFRTRYGARPSVDSHAPDVRLKAFVHQNRCTLALDVAGRSLHRRGYRTAVTPAPLGECLASAAVGLSGWDLKSPFLDPLCGSGTILIEAGMRAANMAPGLLGKEFDFERSPDFDRVRWEEMRERARAAIRIPKKLIVRGSDADPEAVEAARRNIRTAGLEELITVEVADVRDFSPTKGWGATIVTNPPYGVRLEAEETLVPLYEAMGRVFKERCRGFHIYVFVASSRLAKAFRLKPSCYWPLKNAGLDCRLVRYEIR